MFRFSTILCLAFLLTQALPAPAAGPDYVLSRYHADFELVKDGDGKPRDARITLDITYELRNGTKDQGFKYVGTRPIREVSVTDGQGNPLEYAVKKEKEYRIDWRFPPIGQGETQRVRAVFIQEGVLEGSKKENHLLFKWVKNWRIPVYNVRYRFIFPPRYRPDRLELFPKNSRPIRLGNQAAVAVKLRKLGSHPFKIRFSPGLANEKYHIFKWLYGLVKPVFVFVALIGFLLIMGRAGSGNGGGTLFGGGHGGCGGGGGGGGGGGCGG